MAFFDANGYFTKAWDETWKHVDKGALGLFKHYHISEERLAAPRRGRSQSL
jgi:hypothetical protein